jgi:tetratricopeptide (TPR) repeat protein
MRKLILTLITAISICSFSEAQTPKQLPEVGVKVIKGNTLTEEQFIDSISKVIENPKVNKMQLAPLYFFRAEYYRKNNEYDKAYADYSSTIKIDPNFKDAYWNRGLTSDGQNNFQPAINDYSQALNVLSPADSINKAILYCNMAYDEYMLKDPAKALGYDSLSKIYNPLLARAHYVAGLIHLLQKDYVAAIKDFNEAIALFNNYDNKKQLSSWYASLADAKRLNKQYKEAINNYSFALKLNPDNRVAYWNRGAAYHQHKDYELAANDYGTAMGYYKGQNIALSKLYDDRAVNELGQNLWGKAIQDDSVAIALDPNDKIAYVDLAEAYTQNADYQKSIDMLNAALNFSKDNKKIMSFLYYEISNDEYFLNQFDNVIRDCSTAIALNPDNGEPYYYRAKVYLKKFNKKDLAITDFNKVIALDTTHQSVGYVFSLLYIGKGDTAVEVLQKDILNTTDESKLLTDYYNLACLYSIMNKPNEANNYLKMAIDKGYAKKYAAADEDLDNIRNTAEYKTTIGDGK